MTKPPRKYIVEFPQGAVIANMMREIRTIAEDSANVFFSPHAHTQMARRGLTDVEAIRVLKLGEIKDRPWIEPEIGGRACKVVFRPRGSRVIGVVTVIMNAGDLLVKTVEWEDER